jgi:hypothetical protein
VNQPLIIGLERVQSGAYASIWTYRALTHRTAALKLVHQALIQVIQAIVGGGH